ncbi:DMT family transporter [Dechloromonas denitrificans]|uniref:DMT family transporter n=1 Tax=Dechloromonas denitrificans TaxID=281362 RepID=UPI001CFBD7BD|nr:DMT family transporter [Dechloromonas denitrificans]
MTHRRAVGLMVLVALLWSIAGVVTRHLDTAHAFEVTFWRSAFNALALLVVLGCMRGSLLWRGLLRGGWAVWIFGVCWGVMYTAFMLALTLTSVANVLITMAISPLLTALFSRFFLGHRLPMRTWLAIVVAGIGIAWMFAAQGEAGASLLGSLIAGAVPLAGAVNLTVLQRVGKDAVLTEDMLPAVLIGAVLSALATWPLAWPMQVSSHDLGLLALLGVVQLAVPCLLMVRLTRELPAPEVSLLALLEVVFGVTWAWVGAGETPASSVLFGGGLVLAALVVNELLVLHRVS